MNERVKWKERFEIPKPIILLLLLHSINFPIVGHQLNNTQKHFVFVWKRNYSVVLSSIWNDWRV